MNNETSTLLTVYIIFIASLIIICCCVACNAPIHVAQSGKDSSEVYFKTENEIGINYYELQYQKDVRAAWENVYEIDAKGSGDYTFRIGYVPGFYRIKIVEDRQIKYSWIVKLK